MVALGAAVAMARTCTVCTHTERADIDRALVQRRPFRDIACQYDVGRMAVLRHHDEHVPAELLAAREVDDAARGDDLLAQVRDLQGHAMDILTVTKDAEAPDYRTALAAIRELRGCIEVFVKIREAEEMEERVAALERQLPPDVTARRR